MARLLILFYCRRYNYEPRYTHNGASSSDAAHRFEHTTGDDTELALVFMVKLEERGAFGQDVPSKTPVAV